MNSVKVFIKNQSSYFIFLVASHVVPLVLFYLFSPYEANNIQYFVLGLLVLTQYAFFNEKDYRAKIEERIKEQLHSEKKKVPSKSDIVIRSTQAVRHRGVAVLLTGLMILVTMVWFNKF